MGSGNFIANAAAARWSLTGAVGGVVNSDLVAAGDNKSAIFTGHLLGHAQITAVSGGVTGNTGTLTVVNAGPATRIVVEMAANGSGSPVGVQNVTAGSSVTGYAIQRDALGNFIANVASTWSLTSVTGGVGNGDLIPALDGKSAVFTGHVLGTARMTASAGGLTGNSGVQTVVAGPVAMVRVGKRCQR